MKTGGLLHRCTTVFLAVFISISPFTLSEGTSATRSSEVDVCTWENKTDAYSQIYNTCLRLAVRPCECDPSACVAKGVNYRVTKLSHDISCTNTITWCPWEPWISKNFIVQDQCLRISTRTRKCCVKTIDHNYWQNLSISSDDPLWYCSGSDVDKDFDNYSCSNNGIFSTATIIPLAVFSFVICLLIFITCGILVKVTCGPKLSYCCRRALSFVGQNGRMNDAVVEPHSPPSYDEAFNSTALPTYTEAINSNMQLDSLPSGVVHGEVIRPPEVSATVTDPSQGFYNMAMELEEPTDRPVQDSVPVPSELQTSVNSNEGGEEVRDNSYDRSTRNGGAHEDLSVRVPNETRFGSSDL